ncbi:MAG: hypothetical protein ACFFDN_38865 [Candidatus Hodarchaeota archaeon]
MPKWQKKSKMRYKRYKSFILTNEPKQYSSNDYNEVKDKIINIFKNIPSLISIYEIGSISSPGISDLDLVLVFDDNAKDVVYEIYYDKLDDRDKYILMHSPFVITKSLFENIRYFFVPDNFKLLWGDKIHIKEIQQQHLLKQLIAAEFVLGTTFSLIHSLKNKILKVRSFLCVLNAVKYDFQIYGLNRQNFAAGWHLLNSTTELREKWFKMNEKERIKKVTNIFKKAPGILLNMLTSINEKLNDFKARKYVHLNILKYGLNNYVRESVNNKSSYSVRRNFLVSFLGKCFYSKLIDDASWVLSNHLIETPHPLFTLLSENVNSNLKPMFEYRNKIFRDYRQFARRAREFGLLLPPLRSSLKISNLKWRGLIAIRKLFLLAKNTTL